MSVYITYNETLTFGGTFDPAFCLTIVSFSPDFTALFSLKLIAVLLGPSQSGTERKL